MLDVLKAQEFQESKIEDEPILGRVLVFPGGRIQTLTFVERLLLTLRLTDAKRLETVYLKPMPAWPARPASSWSTPAPAS